MKNLTRVTLAVVMMLIAATAYAQKTTVSYDFVDEEGHRIIQTNTIVAVKPSKTFYPISISLDYCEAIPENYSLMLYGRYPLSKSTILTLAFDDGDKMQLSPYSLDVVMSKLGLITPKKVYIQYFPLADSQLDKILNSNIKEISVDIDGAVHSKVYRTKEVSKWLMHNYRDIQKSIKE